ncbi:MAG: hypothetical protein IKC19_07360 [Bacteroidales bacterium]|nr:hypothetical protein [Bacteroidales bacterium]
MRRLIVFVIALLPLVATAQNVKIPKGANEFTYHQIEYGEQNDTTEVYVHRDNDVVTIVTQKPKGKLIPGYCQTVTEVDYAQDSITVNAYYDDSIYFYRTGFSRNDLEWKKENGKWKTSVNSNTLEFEMDEKAPVNVNPLPYYGLNKGVLRTFTRNGQKRLVLAKAEKVDWGMCGPLKVLLPSRRVSPRELDRIMKERLVVTTRIFDHEQICWGKANAHIDGGLQAVPSDTVLHYAGGTLILKKVKLPRLPHHYQHFVELHQQSNGDAYDRTGSLFIVTPGFFEGINNHPDSLPVFTGRDGQRYQGMMATGSYQPPIELVRFFTPFGVGHFNERMAGYGIDWRDETFYRQEITDLYYRCMDDQSVCIGIWIGNYDAGGHRVTVDIKSYPNDYVWEEPGEESEFPGEVVSLFNTCNVLEMAGQNYGKLFATDSLTVTFRLEDIDQSAELRYISTGHGGWGEGDEFVPKTNTILIDGKPVFTHTPWRQDCGCYRDLNPVSGNFWNGLSSSDFSRSGWCPGTATQPVYFDLSPWADGKEHTLTVAIPQGKPVEGMFSHWAVSGVLIVEY